MTAALGHTALELLSGDELERPRGGAQSFGGVLGRSAVMRDMFTMLERAAASDSAVLLEGESGTGKEVIAQAIHHASARARGPFQVIDCGAIPPTLIESEIFGVKSGAFTGAIRDRPGAIQEAAGGTLFLDEIGELPAEMQPRLLRALERRMVKPVGSNHYVAVDFRVVAATNRDLGQLVEQGRFRADLFYRLAVIPIRVPALRHRHGDIPLLARHFLASLRGAGAGRAIGCDGDGPLTSDILAAFAAHDWPGNVRELRNAVERLVAMGGLAAVPGSAPGACREEAAATTARTPAPPHPVTEYQAARRAAIERFERDYCRAMLDGADGVVTRAAERAGISRQMFHRLLRRHGVA